MRGKERSSCAPQCSNLKGFSRTRNLTHVPIASQLTPRVNAAHGLQYTTNTRNYLQLLDGGQGRLISREGPLVSGPTRGFNGSQTQNSVPEDGFNETNHHVLLHGLSLLPLPTSVHTWYVSNVSIIFDCSMLLHYQSLMFYNHFIVILHHFWY